MSNLGTKLAKNFITSFEKIQAEKGDDLTIGDLDALFKHVRSKRREEVYHGIEDISEKLNSVRIEVFQPHAGTVSEEKIPDAHLELEAVISAAEDATNTILDCVENIQNKLMALGLPETETDAIFEDITSIFEACNFQDITGQRISKVVHTLMEVDSSIAELMTAIHGKVEISVKDREHEASDADLMNGPQLEAPTQDDIDKLFSGG